MPPCVRPGRRRVSRSSWGRYCRWCRVGKVGKACKTRSTTPTPSSRRTPIPPGTVKPPTETSLKEFRVHFTTGEPPRSDQPVNNTFGLTGEGKLIVDDNALTFEGKRTGLTFGGAPRIALADVANIDYNAESRAFLL